MPLTPTQIAGAVNYFTQSGNSIAATQRQILAPPAPVAAPKVVAAAVKSAPVSSSGSTSNPAINTSFTGGAPNAVDWLLNPLSAALRTPFSHDNGTGSKSSSLAQDAAVPEGHDQAPKNAAQWMLNLLSTGTYAGGRFMNQIGHNVAEQQAANNDPNNKTINPENNPLGYIANIGTGVGKDIAAAARGVAEGAGARFNDQAPITPGDDLKTVGGEAAIKQGVKNVGGDAGWQNWTAGAAGTAADVLGDPTTYIGGVGLVKGLKEGAAATVDALKAGGRLDESLMAGGAAFSKGAAGARAAAAEGKLTSADKLAAAANPVDLKTQLATEAAQRAAATDLPVTVESVAADAATAAKEPVATVPVNTPDNLPTTAKPVIPLPTDGAGKLAEAVMAEHPAMAGIRNLLPQLSTVGREVDAGKILSDARVPVEGATIAPEVAATATSVLHDAKTVPEISAGLKTLKATPEGKAFLATPLKVEGVPATVGAALERGAMARVTGGSVSGNAARAAVDAHLATSGAAATKTTLGSLSSAISTAAPELGVGAEPLNTPALMGALAATKSQPARQKIVANLLNLPKQKFQSFDQAINAATSGQVEASAMRSMLKALGITSRATKPDTLMSVLAGKGKLAWDEIQKGVPTAQEVLDNHGISAEQADAAKLVDVAAERAGANAEAVSATQEFTPTQASLFQLAMERGHSDGTLTPTDPAYVETYNKKLYNTINQPVLAQAARAANQITDPAERAVFMYDHVVPVLAAADKALLSEGRVARLVSSDGTSFYATLSDIIPLLQRDTAEAALFPETRALPVGQAYIDKLPSAELKKGFTIYPTSIGFGAKAAREGKDVFAVAQAMIDDSGANLFAKSPEGKALINQIAAELTTPENVAALTELDTTNRVLAVANAQKAATDFVNPLASDIIAGAAAGGDRAETIVPAVKAAKSVASMKKADDGPSLVQDMSAQRVHNGTVQTLGEEGTTLARSDARQADATPKQQMEKQAASNAKPVRRTKAGEKIPAKIPAKGSVKDSQKGAEALSTLRDDSNERINTDAISLIEDGTHPDTATGHIEAQIDAEFGIGHGLDMAKLEQPSVISQQAGNALDALNEAFNGLAHEGDYEGTGGVRQSWVNGPKSMNHEYGTRLATWNAQLGARITQATGVDMADANAVTAKIKLWLNALQAHGAHALARGQIMDDDDLSAALATAIENDPAAGLHKAAAPLDPAEIPFAVELQHHIDQIAPRGGVGGAYSRMGANPVDVAHQLATYKQAGDEFDIDPGQGLAEQQSSWHLWNAAEMPDPLNTLFRWHQAIMASSIEPGIGQSAARLFGHDGIMGLSRADALAKGWRPIDPEHANGLFQYIPKDTLFPPELHAQMAATQMHLDQMRAIGTLDGSKVLAAYDRVLGVAKDSMTAWNPSHSVTVFLSDAGMNLLHGVDGRWGFMALRAQFAGGQLDKDPALIEEAAHNSAFADAATASKSWSKFGKPTLTVTIKNSKQDTVGVEWTPAQIHESAMRNGVDATLHQIADKIDPGTQGDTAGLWDRVARSKFNPVSQVNKKLNQWGVIRDNVARYTQYVHALQSRSFRSIDEAEHYAAAQVHLAHPLPSALSKFERTTVRRVVTFYSWQRLALGRVLELGLEKPGLVTLPSKYQYEQAQAAGFDPESIGKPFGNDPRIASYESNGIFGPTFSGGYSPLGGTADLAGGQPHQWGFSISSPSMDALESAFQGATFNSDGTLDTQNVLETLGSNVSPLLAVPAELFLDSQPGGVGAPPSQNYGQFLLNQTGAPGRIAKAAGLEPKTLASGKPANSPAQQAGENSRQALNYLTGLKFTDYTNDTSAAYAAKEQAKAAASAPAPAITKAQISQWVAAGYTPQQIKLLQATK
jgi:hypothetical protein